VERLEYDEAASEALHMDVVYEVPEDKPVTVARWLESMRRLNSIEDPLARRLLKLHRACGSGTGECDSADEEAVTIADCADWACETTRLITGHFGIEYPAPATRG
jgi:hypothetical protein